MVLMVALFCYTEISLYLSPQALRTNSIVFGQETLRQYDNYDYNVGIQVPSDYIEGGSGVAWFATFTPSPTSFYLFTIYLDAQNYNGDLPSFTSEYIQSLVNSGSFPDLRLGSTIDTSLGGYAASAIVYSYIDSRSGSPITTMDIIAKNYNNGWIYTLSFVGSSQAMAHYTTTAGIADIAGTFQFK